MFKKIKSFFIFLILILSSCRANLLSNLSSVSTDDYLLEEAKKANNEEYYDNAIDILENQISDSAKALTTTKELLATSYAGKCGLNFVNYTSSLANGLSGSPFRIIMQPFIGVAATPNFCTKALTVMDTIGPPEQRSTNDNAFTAITGLVLMGASLRTNSDMFPSLGDGTADVNLCVGLTDAQINEVIIGFGYFNTNFAYVSQSLIGSSSFSSLTDMVQLCNSYPGVDCAQTDPTQINSTTRDFIRDLINTSEYGIGGYSINNNPVNIPASCP